MTGDPESGPSEEELILTVEDGIGTVTFNRPAARNAFTFAMYERLREVCETIADDGMVKALILRGAGDRAAAQRFHERFAIDQTAACSVDQDRARFHAVEFVCANESASVVGQRAVQ